jgi:hypothetical protein
LCAIGAIAGEFFAIFAGAIADAPFRDTAGAFNTKAFSGHAIRAEAGGKLDIAELAGGAATIAGRPCFVIATCACTLSAIGADTGFFFADFIALVADDAALFAIRPCAATADFDAILSIAALAGEGIEFAASAGDTSASGEALTVCIAGARTAAAIGAIASAFFTGGTGGAITSAPLVISDAILFALASALTATFAFIAKNAARFLFTIAIAVGFSIGAAGLFTADVTEAKAFFGFIGLADDGGVWGGDAALVAGHQGEKPEGEPEACEEKGAQRGR